MRLFLLFSHSLTPEQRSEASERFGVKEFVTMPAALQSEFSSVEPEGELSVSLLERLQRWLSEHAASGDYALIQGEYGVTYYMVEYCFAHGITPLYATTRRESEEQLQENGVIRKVQHFKHVTFRLYPEYTSAQGGKP